MDKQKARKRVVVVSDFHCGHRVGLTPPAWWGREDTELQAKIHRNQVELWNWYKDELEKLKPIDILIVNGDCIDGKGDRSGGCEQNTSDRIIQCDMACTCITEADAAKILLIFGTSYHTGKDEDFESVIARTLPEDKVEGIEGHAFPEINGLQFDIKHKIGGSGVPHGRYTALARDKLWNTVWHNRDEKQPKAGVLIRSHVHYMAYCGDPYWLAMTTPALQGFGSAYGVRQCSGVVDIGFVHFDIIGKDEYTWSKHVAELSQCKVRPLKL